MHTSLSPERALNAVASTLNSTPGQDANTFQKVERSNPCVNKAQAHRRHALGAKFAVMRVRSVIQHTFRVRVQACVL